MRAMEMGNEVEFNRAVTWSQSNRYKPKALGNSLDPGLPNGCDLERPSQFKYQKGLEISAYTWSTPLLTCCLH